MYVPAFSLSQVFDKWQCLCSFQGLREVPSEISERAIQSSSSDPEFPPPFPPTAPRVTALHNQFTTSTNFAFFLWHQNTDRCLQLSDVYSFLKLVKVALSIIYFKLERNCYGDYEGRKLYVCFGQLKQNPWNVIIPCCKDEIGKTYSTHNKRRVNCLDWTNPKRLIARFRHIWEDNIKMDSRCVEYEDVNRVLIER